MSRSASSSLLLKQFKELTRSDDAMPGFRIELADGNIYQWDVSMIVLNKASIYYGGYFKALLTFPTDYPYSPPSFRFRRPFFHPNVYRDGKVCVSILHPGVDDTSGEDPSERWSPAQSVESVLISIVSLLEDPNPDSPANVDAAVMWRANRPAYNKIAQKLVEESKNDIPEDFVMPQSDSYSHADPKPADPIDDNFWYDEDVDEDFDDDDEWGSGEYDDDDDDDDGQAEDETN
ncbi:ubiquitin-conjugating enzyme and catalytic subunit of SCF ubiquitin-protein ligase [Lipomyces oligophaga]|uniref:ubiquitin-conjugating enzyme and catalytic subunit of SCF ubiquitin-protein ligase n=1 Tax=Lipomyces oligophaga TaxID=45792 RepID=UPI0034CE6758